MKKIITPFATTLLALGFTSQQADAQRFYTVEEEAVSEISTEQTYFLHCPWQNEAHYLAGTGYLTNPEAHGAYQFEAAGQDGNGNTTYRLKQVVTNLYLEDPTLSKGKVTMTQDMERAFIFTALDGEPFSATRNENGKNIKTDSWDEFIKKINEDPRHIYDDQSLDAKTGAKVFANKDYATSDRKVLCFSSDPTWDQYAAQRIFYLYNAAPATGFDDITNLFMYGYYPDNVEAVKTMFKAGDAPGQVAKEKVDHFVETWQKAMDLTSQSDFGDEVYREAIDNLAAAKKACVEGVNPVKEGYYIVSINPASDRVGRGGKSSACLFEKEGGLYWNGYEIPENKTVEDAAYIWEVKKAENGGWYLRNYGTGRYAGGLNATNQLVPSTAEAQQVFDISHRSSDCFSVDMRGQNGTYPSLHADANAGFRIVIWGTNASASQWSFLPVDKAEIQGIEGQLEQTRINNEAKTLIANAKADYEKGFVYASKDMTRDGVFVEGDGLVTKGAAVGETDGQLRSNALESPEKESGNSYRNLLDNNFDTYFHTVWSVENADKSFHYLDVDLGKDVEAFNIKYAKRHNAQNGSPTRIHVFASNDTVGGKWSDQGYMTCEYPYAITANGETKNNFSGVASKKLDQAYKYVRLQVEGTAANSKTNNNLFWYWSEFRMYEAMYDEAASLINVVPKDIRDNFTKLLKQLEGELAAGKVLSNTLEDFKKAYEAFLDNYPDPQVVKNLLEEARAFAAPGTAQESDELGYFKSGASAALTEALDAVAHEVKDVMSVVEIKSAKAKIEKALADFNKQLNMPEAGTYYYIKCATASNDEGSAAENYLYALNNDESQVKYAKPEDLSVYLHYVWKTVKNNDGSYSFQNCGTGTYLGNPKKNDVRVMMSFDADTVTLRSAKSPGVFNFVCGDNFFYNAQPKSGNLVTWGSANELDNSAFILEEAKWNETSAQLDLAKSGLQVLSVPFAFTGSSSDIYKVLGVKDGMLQLAKYDDKEEVPAGTPFIADVEKEEEAAPYIELYTETTLEALSYVFEGKVQNGLKATLQGVSKVAGAGILFGDKVITATQEDVVTANTGYFVAMPSATNQSGDKEIKFPTTIVETGVSNLTIVSSGSAKTGVYTLTGVKLGNDSDTRNLPKGLYIIGGEKVLVK